jgi:hypothetical protein
MTLPPTIKLSLRSAAGNDNHHLWNNNGTWWCHLTLHSSSGTKQRVRRSLKTGDLATARRRRDQLLARLGATLAASVERRAA